MLGGSREMPYGPLDSNALALPGISGRRDKLHSGHQWPLWSPHAPRVQVTGTAVCGVTCSEQAQYLKDFSV